MMTTGVASLLVKAGMVMVTVGAGMVMTRVWLDARETLPAASRLKAEMVLLPLPSDRLKVVTGTAFQLASEAMGAVVPTTTA